MFKCLLKPSNQNKFLFNFFLMHNIVTSVKLKLMLLACLATIKYVDLLLIKYQSC